MIETQGPALEAEAAYRRERAGCSFAARRAAYERRAAHARATQDPAPVAARPHAMTSVLRGWRLPGSGAWHVAR
jgi:hypothetical protein